MSASASNPFEVWWGEYRGDPASEWQESFPNRIQAEDYIIEQPDGGHYTIRDTRNQEDY